MNAALTGVAERATRGFTQALAAAGVQATPFLSQNDGTLMTLAYAAEYPVLTVASGPTNSLRGGALLSGRTDAVVIDVGGTTADFGALRGGFPRESGIAVEIGGVLTNFRMPDLVSVGAGRRHDRPPDRRRPAHRPGQRRARHHPPGAAASAATRSR